MPGRTGARSGFFGRHGSGDGKGHLRLPAQGAGEIYTFTTIHVPPEGFEDKVPYTVVVVKLDEGTLVS
ncbi:OB-fold domain-containing protein, partial [Acetomicrobium sp. S15 = DSM 107314]|uniref:OB-fold domain-containing protein n=1 Tax=Acetomicrobium sp. S15 = DSM 107314 TaxID=2529858 RepID=UPI0018E0FA70